jgi:hypothetical protein
MKQIRLGIVMFALLLFVGAAVSQSRARRGSRPAAKSSAAVSKSSPDPSTAKRPVTVNLREGDPIQGYFLRSDGETVQLEIRSGSMSIRLSEIESMTFSNDEPTISISKPRIREEDPDETPAPKEGVSKANARKAYVALRKLSDAARINLPYPEYGALVVETRSLIEQLTPTVTDIGLKNDIQAAMDAYTDAGQAWGTYLQKDEISVKEDPGATLMRKYSIKPGLNRLGNETYLPLDETLKTIWNAAGARLRNVAVLVDR